MLDNVRSTARGDVSGRSGNLGDVFGALSGKREVLKEGFTRDQRTGRVHQLNAETGKVGKMVKADDARMGRLGGAATILKSFVGNKIEQYYENQRSPAIQGFLDRNIRSESSGEKVAQLQGQQSSLLKGKENKSTAQPVPQRTKPELKVVQGGAEFVIVNFDGLEIIQDEIANGGFDLIVADEASAYKNIQTNRWKTLKTLLTPDTWLWMLTGTPASQSPVDAFGLAKLVSPERVPKYMGAFRDTVMHKVTQFRWVVKPNAETIVHEALQPAIRFTKEQCLDLPEMTYVTRDVPLTAQQQKYIH
jgi:hypothetical protein